jgi:hypothetical protein
LWGTYILEVVAKDSKDRWMKWEQGALSAKVLTQRYQTQREIQEKTITKMIQYTTMVLAGKEHINESSWWLQYWVC